MNLINYLHKEIIETETTLTVNYILNKEQANILNENISNIVEQYTLDTIEENSLYLIFAKESAFDIIFPNPLSGRIIKPGLTKDKENYIFTYTIIKNNKNININTF